MQPVHKGVAGFKKDGFDLLTHAGIVKLGQAKRQRKGFLLSLRAEAPNRLSVDEEEVVIFMNPEISKTAMQVRLRRLLQAFCIRGSLQPRLVLDRDILRTA